MGANAVVPILVAACAIAAAFAIVTRKSNQRVSSHATPWRGVALAAIVLAGFGTCLYLLSQAISYRSPLFALNVAADILGFVALLRPVFDWPLPERVRPLRAWEERGALYRAIGVPLFGAAIRRPPLCYLNSMVYAGAHARRLDPLRASMLAAEGAHFWAVVFTAPLVAILLAMGWWASLAWVVAFEVALNAYPIFHLRSVRGRLEAVLARRRAA